MAFIAGAFNAELGGSSLGQLANGFEIEYFMNGQLVTGDNFGRSPQDMVFQGLEMFVRCELIEFSAPAAQSAYWPWDACVGKDIVVGNLAVEGSKTAALVFEARAGAPANITNADTYTFARAILAEGFPLNSVFNAALHTVPLRFRIFPTEISSQAVWYTVG